MKVDYTMTIDIQPAINTLGSLGLTFMCGAIVIGCLATLIQLADKRHDR